MVFGLLFFLLLVLDQLSKFFANIYLHQLFCLINKFFYLTYLENRGAAFGILQNKQWVFIGLSLVVSGVLIGWLIRTRRSEKPALFNIAIIFLLAGTLGNMLDRVWHGYVIDFISISSFPVFNFADVFINVGVIGFVISYLSSNKIRD